MSIKDFVQKRRYIFWYVEDASKLSEESIVEHILNYGDFDDVREMISILGMKKTAGIFDKQASGKRSNYRPEIKNYFNLYFKKYAK